MKRTVALAGAFILLLTACSDAPGVESDVATKEGKGRNERNADGKPDGSSGKKDGKPGSSSQQPSGGSDGVPAEATEPPGTGNADQGGFGDDPTPSDVDPSLARVSQNVPDSDSDSTKQGLVPDHAELIGASIQGVGRNVRLILRFDGAVPEESPDDKTYMVVGWGIAAGGDESYGFSAQAGEDGWKVYAGGKGKSTEFPGTFTIDGNAVIMELPWDYIGGPREFQWQTNSSWFRQLANTTHYSFDLCPNDDPARFPGG